MYSLCILRKSDQRHLVSWHRLLYPSIMWQDYYNNQCEMNFCFEALWNSFVLHNPPEHPVDRIKWENEAYSGRLSIVEMAYSSQNENLISIATFWPVFCLISLLHLPVYSVENRQKPQKHLIDSSIVGAIHSISGTRSTIVLLHPCDMYSFFHTNEYNLGVFWRGGHHLKIFSFYTISKGFIGLKLMNYRYYLVLRLLFAVAIPRL